MIINDLWIISRSGLPLFRYKSENSDFQADELLFAGFITALSAFADSLANKRNEIEFLKLMEDEISFTFFDEIIVASIFSETSRERDIIKHMLNYVGRQFLKKYQMKIYEEKDVAHDWKEITKDFLSEIEFICRDGVFDEFRRDLMNKLIMEAIQGELSPNLLFWQLTRLVENTSPDRAGKVLELFSSLMTIIPKITKDLILESKIKDTLIQVSRSMKSLESKQKKQLLIFCENDDFVEQFSFKILSFDVICVAFRSLEQLRDAVSEWNVENLFNVLLVKNTFEDEEIEVIKQIKLPETTKIYWWRPSGEVQSVLDSFEDMEVVPIDCDRCFESGDCPELVKIVGK